MSMQKYDEAVAAARSVLAINDAIANYNEMIIMVQGYLLGGQYPAVLRPQMKCEEDLSTFTIPSSSMREPLSQRQDSNLAMHLLIKCPLIK